MIDLEVFSWSSLLKKSPIETITEIPMVSIKILKGVKLLLIKLIPHEAKTQELLQRQMPCNKTNLEK